MGIADGQRGCGCLRDVLAVDAIDYTSEDIQERLAELCRNGVDVEVSQPTPLGISSRRVLLGSGGQPRAADHLEAVMSRMFCLRVQRTCASAGHEASARQPARVTRRIMGHGLGPAAQD